MDRLGRLSRFGRSRWVVHGGSGSALYNRRGRASSDCVGRLRDRVDDEVVEVEGIGACAILVRDHDLMVAQRESGLREERHVVHRAPGLRRTVRAHDLAIDRIRREGRPGRGANLDRSDDLNASTC